MHCGICDSPEMPCIYPLCDTPGTSQLPYHNACSKINMTLSRIHTRNVSCQRRACCARETQGQGRRSQKWMRVSGKNCQKSVRRCSVEHSNSLFCVFCPVPSFVKKFGRGGYLTDWLSDWRPRDFSDARARKLCSSNKEDLAQTWRGLDTYATFILYCWCKLFYTKSFHAKAMPGFGWLCPDCAITRPNMCRVACKSIASELRFAAG